MRFRLYNASFPLIPAFSLGEKENWVPSLLHISVCRRSIAIRPFWRKPLFLDIPQKPLTQANEARTKEGRKERTNDTPRSASCDRWDSRCTTPPFPSSRPSPSGRRRIGFRRCCISMFVGGREPFGPFGENAF